MFMADEPNPQVLPFLCSQIGLRKQCCATVHVSARMQQVAVIDTFLGTTEFRQCCCQRSEGVLLPLASAGHCIFQATCGPFLALLQRQGSPSAAWHQACLLFLQPVYQADHLFWQPLGDTSIRQSPGAQSQMPLKLCRQKDAPFGS